MREGTRTRGGEEGGPAAAGPQRYLSGPVVGGGHQPPVVVRAPRQTGDLGRVPGEGPEGLCDGHWRFRVTLWKTRGNEDKQTRHTGGESWLQSNVWTGCGACVGMLGR